MSRDVSLALLKPIHDVFPPDPPTDTWAQDMQVAADAVYGSLGAAAADALTVGQYAALADLVYVAGVDAFSGSAIRRLILAGNLAMATYQFEAWVIGADPVTGQPAVLPALVRRRAADRAIWLS